MGHPNYLTAWLFVVTLTLLGCGSADEPPLETTPAAASASAAAVPPPQPAANPPKSPEVADAAAEAAAKAEPVAQFSPPFPDRELFEAPKRAQSTVRRDDAGETVELKGFINVDQPRVVLAIDGVISSIPEGGEKYGVQVRSIQPPSVVLVRGRNRWIATLE